MSKTKTHTKPRVKGITLEHGVVTDVRLADLHPDPNQPRKSFSEGALLALADSIRERDVMVPLLVRYDDARRLVIVDGERRWRAAKLAKRTVVPVLLRDTGTIDEQQQRLDQVGVNQQREPLKPMELARVLRGLRDAGKTVNDIAATLARQGHPAMKPAAIDELATLTDLPEWAQDMVNAEQIEAKHAGDLLPILKRPKVDAPLQKAMKRSLGYNGKLLGHNVRHVGAEALEQAGGVNLANVESWHRKPHVHFAWKTRCKGCEHLQRWSDGAFCMHRKTFEEHNQEAKDAGLLPGGRKPEKARPVTGKAAAAEEKQKDAMREKSLQQKAREYLHAYLCVALVEELPKRPELHGQRGDGEPGDVDDDLETVCIGCGCTHTDPCEEGCGWKSVEEWDNAASRYVAVCSSPACAAHLARFEAGDWTLSPEAKARVEEREAMRGDDDEASDDQDAAEAA